MLRALSVLALLACSLNQVHAAVLPEDRADVLYHRYDGDDSVFDGPSILVRKQFKDKVSVWGNYYIDFNSAASIDVITQGSPYEEERIETSVGLDYLYDRTILSASVKQSDENDYQAESYSLGVSQDFFGDMSTLSLSYSSGDDEVYRNIREGPGRGDISGREFCGNATHQRFGIGWTQVLTKNWIVALNAEGSVDEGFLNNCYRSVRFITGVTDDGRISTARQLENYPKTRNSEAYSVKGMYFLPWRAGLKLEYRGFTDSWGIKASNYELRYTHPWKNRWIFEGRFRAYDQTQADFYSELFNFRDEFEFIASDKELSTYTTQAIGLGVTYELEKQLFSWIDRATINVYVDYLNYDYENFLDKRQSAADLNPAAEALPNPGEEDPFGFNAVIGRVFFSIWY